MSSSTLTWVMVPPIALLAVFAVYTMVTLPHRIHAAQEATAQGADDDSLILTTVRPTPVTVGEHAAAIADTPMSSLTYRQWLMGQALAGACNHLEYDVCVDEAVSKVDLLLRKLAYEKMGGQTPKR